MGVSFEVGGGNGAEAGAGGCEEEGPFPPEAPLPGGVPGGCRGSRAGLGDKGAAHGRPICNDACGWGRRLLLGFRETRGNDEGGTLPSPGPAPGTWSSLMWNWGSGLQ